jgi:hypothetical protein
MAKIYVGNKFKIRLDCKKDVNGQSDLWIIYEKPISGAIGRWQATGVGDFAEYNTIKDIDIDEHGIWDIQPFSDTLDVHGDKIPMEIFPPLIPWLSSILKGFLEGVE